MTYKIVLLDPETRGACENCVFNGDNCGDDDHVSNDPLFRQHVGNCLNSPTSYYMAVDED